MFLFFHSHFFLNKKIKAGQVPALQSKLKKIKEVMCITALWHHNIINWKISQHEYFLSFIFLCYNNIYKNSNKGRNIGQVENFKIREKITDLIEKYSKEGCYEIRKEKNKIYICDSSEKYIDFHDGKFVSISGGHELEFMEISQGEDCFTIRAATGVTLRGNYADFLKRKKNIRRASRWRNHVKISIGKNKNFMKLHSKNESVAFLYEGLMAEALKIFLETQKETCLYKDFEKLFIENGEYGFSWFHIPKDFNEKTFRNYGSLASFISDREGLESYRKIISRIPLPLMGNICDLITLEYGKEIVLKILENRENFKRLKGGYATISEIIMLFLEITGKTSEWGFSKSRKEEYRKYKGKIYRIWKLSENGSLKNIMHLIKCKSFEEVQKFHGELIRKRRKKYIEKFKPAPLGTDEKFVKLYNEKFSVKFENCELIDDARRLFMEGMKQKNCSFSYKEEIKDGKCMIFSLKESGKRYTGKIIFRNGRFVLDQFLGRENLCTKECGKLKGKIKKIIE